MFLMNLHYKVRKAAEKQALINQIALLKPGQSILVSENELQYPKVKKFVEDVLQERFSQKKLVYKKIIEKGVVIGTRIWCDPEKVK